MTFPNGLEPQRQDDDFVLMQKQTQCLYEIVTTAGLAGDVPGDFVGGLDVQTPEVDTDHVLLLKRAAICYTLQQNNYTF